MPSFLNFNEVDSIIQIEIDESRNLVYTRSQNSSIQVSHPQFTIKNFLFYLFIRLKGVLFGCQWFRYNKIMCNYMLNNCK